MPTKQSQTDFDVIQIGYGPVSKVQALLLDRKGWKIGIFERWTEVYPLPRATCIDHEIFRILQASGLGPIVEKVAEPAPVYRWFNSKWQEILSIDWTANTVSGTPEVYFLHQPTLERELDNEVTRRDNISLFLKSECVAVSQNDEMVTVRIRDAETGLEKDYTARYVIGIDGANSIVRESLGITRSDKGFEADWLVVDFKLREGLTARDLNLPEAAQYCNPKRPTTLVEGGTDGNRKLRRWEFMRLPHETQEEMKEEAKVHELLRDWIKPDQGDLVRHALYTFRSLLADSWREKRVLLAGDAAHLMPPFMGQGMCAGFRDAWNLAWKLDLVLRGAASDNLLDTYEQERTLHVGDVIDISVFLGEIICIPDEAKAAERDALFLSDNPPPPAPFPILTQGFLHRGTDGTVIAPAGELSAHGFVRCRGRTMRFDSMVPPGWNLILSEENILDCLSDTARNTLEVLNIKIVTVVPRAGAPDDKIADTQGQILPFMADQGVNAMLVRPDLYLFGGSKDSSSLEAMIFDFEQQARSYGFVS